MRKYMCVCVLVCVWVCVFSYAYIYIYIYMCICEWCLCVHVFEYKLIIHNMYHIQFVVPFLRFSFYEICSVSSSLFSITKMTKQCHYSNAITKMTKQCHYNDHSSLLLNTCTYIHVYAIVQTYICTTWTMETIHSPRML